MATSILLKCVIIGTHLNILNTKYIYKYLYFCLAGMQISKVNSIIANMFPKKIVFDFQKFNVL